MESVKRQTNNHAKEPTFKRKTALSTIIMMDTCNEEQHLGVSDQPFEQFSVSMRASKIDVSGPVAWVHGIEKSRQHKKKGEPGRSCNYGTNIFVNRDGRWLVSLHGSATIPNENSKR